MHIVWVWCVLVLPLELGSFFDEKVVGCGCCTGEQTQLKYTVIAGEERSCVVYTKEKNSEKSEKEEEGEKKRRMRTLYLYMYTNPACSIVQYMSC